MVSRNDDRGQGHVTEGQRIAQGRERRKVRCRSIVPRPHGKRVDGMVCYFAFRCLKSTTSIR